MARKSRKNLPQSEQATVSVQFPELDEEKIATAIYGRLSVEDDEDNESMETQIALVQDFINRNSELNYVDTYFDNGFTGTNFKRPAFTRLMNDVRQKKIKCIVVKDLSRFGRNYLEAGYYIETVFPFLGVRLIAVTDNFDSTRKEDMESLALPIRNMVNTMYAKDISKKVWTSLQRKKEAGYAVGSDAPFGYIRNPVTKRNEIDPETAFYVQLIFQWVLMGVAIFEIARRLTLLNVPTPREWHRKIVEGKEVVTYKKWGETSVRHMLANQTYVGDTVNNKSTQKFFAGQDKRDLSKEQWHVTRNTHTLNPSSQYSLDIQALLADWESGNKSRRMILSYDQRIMTGQYPVADLMGYRHTKDGQLVIEPEEAKTVRFIFLAFIQGYDYEQIAMILTQKKRSTLRGRQEWNGMMVANIMKNERRWGDLEARKSIVVDYKLGKVTKNNGNRCSAYVPEHHEAIVSPGIARAAHLVASSKKKCGVQDIVVIQQGALKGFVGIHPNWSGISVDSIHSLCLRAYLPEEVAKLNDIAEMRAGTKLEKPLRSEYLTISGTCFINQSSPVITISKNGIRFSKACHTRLDDCEHVELLYHPILQVVILRKSNRDASTAIHWENKDKICSSFSSKAFSGVIFEAMNWKWSCRYQCRGICRGEENAKFLIFELDESRILIRKNQYEQIEDRSMNLKCRLYRSKWVQSITVSDVMESGQVVENPMIGAIPSRNEVQRELDDLLMSM